MYDEYDVKADQIASDIGPVYAVTQEEAHSLARFHFPNESPDVQEGVAKALYRSYCAEQWTDPQPCTCAKCERIAREIDEATNQWRARLATRLQRRGPSA